MTASTQLGRRSLLISAAAIGGGLSLGLRIPFGLAGVQAADSVPEVNAWVVIRPDDTVVIRIARSEMGQGTLTGLAQLVAEELECDWSKITTEYPTPGQNVARNRVWGNFSTGGSRGIRESNQYVREGGAAARDMLIRAAAAGWGVPPAECSAASSVITHKPSGRTTTYGKVAAEAAKLDPPKDIKLKDPKDWTLIGTPAKRLDSPDKVNGRAQFGIDVKVPGMKVATVAACPVFGGKLASVDDSKARAVNGVRQVVRLDNAVAVVADHMGAAKKGLAALVITWDNGPNANLSSADIVRQLADALV